MKKTCKTTIYSPNSVARFGFLRKGQGPVFIRGGLRDGRQIWWPLQHKSSFTFRFQRKSRAKRLPGDLSRNPLVTFGLSDRSGCGAVLIFRSPALIAVWCSFSARSRSPGLSDRSHCGAVLIFSALAQPRLVGSLSLRCGAHFQRARAAQACRIALIAVRCSFSARSRNPLSTLGLSDHSRCGAVFLLIVEEILRRDLDQEVF